MLTRIDIKDYFKAEKSESLFFIVSGVVSVILSVIFYFGMNTNFFMGASIPFVILGFIQLFVGAAVYRRSDGDIQRVITYLEYQPAALSEIEYPRMRTVLSNFRIFRFTEIILLIAGIATYVWRKYAHPEVEIRTPNDLFWQGFGIALAFQAALLLFADYFAERRAKVYTRLIKSHIHKTSKP